MLPPAITPGLIALDYDENFLQQSIAALGLLVRAGVVALKLHNITGEPEEGPKEVEPFSAEPQGTYYSSDPQATTPPVYYDPETGQVIVPGEPTVPLEGPIDPTIFGSIEI